MGKNAKKGQGAKKGKSDKKGQGAKKVAFGHKPVGLEVGFLVCPCTSWP